MLLKVRDKNKVVAKLGGSTFFAFKGLQGETVAFTLQSDTTIHKDSLGISKAHSLRLRETATKYFNS